MSESEDMKAVHVDYSFKKFGLGWMLGDKMLLEEELSHGTYPFFPTPLKKGGEMLMLENISRSTESLVKAIGRDN